MNPPQFIRGKVDKIDKDGLVLKDKDGSFFRVNKNDIFIGHEEPVFAPKFNVSVRPFSIAVGESVVFHEITAGIASRAAAIDALMHDWSTCGCEIDVTVLEIHRNYIVAVSDEGVPVLLSSAETYKRLGSAFVKRLRPFAGDKRGSEPFWLYPGDRIRSYIYIQDCRNCGSIKALDVPFIRARIVARGVASRLSEDEKDAELNKMAGHIPYARVVYVGECEDDLARRIGHELNCEVMVLRGVSELGTWALDLMAETESDEHNDCFCLVLVGASDLGLIKSVINAQSDLVFCGVRYDVVVCLAGRERTGNLSVFDGLGIVGLWYVDSGLFGFLSLINQDVLDIVQPIEDVQPTSQLLSANYNSSLDKLASGKNDISSHLSNILAGMITLFAKHPENVAVFVFSIDLSGHNVRIEASEGADSLIKGFTFYKAHLHKSPIRDLAILHMFDEVATDCGNSADHRGRFLYFLDCVLFEKTCGRIGKISPSAELSCRGYLLESLPNDNRARVCFIVCGENNGLDDTEHKRQLMQHHLATLNALILGRAYALQLKVFREFALRANDFSFVAHECESYVNRALSALEEAKKGYGHSDVLPCIINSIALLKNTQAAHDQMCPSASPVSHTGILNIETMISDILSAEKIQSGKSKIKFEVDTSGLHGNIILLVRPIVLNCVLRNVISNARHQLVDYGKNKGVISVRFELGETELRQRELIIAVEDNGPGIHARYADHIFRCGFTNRQNGRGLGLAAVRRSFEKEDWGNLSTPSLVLTKSILYYRTIFTIRMPVEVLE